VGGHQGDWVAVGPLVNNALRGALSHACHLIDYGHWADPRQGGPVNLLSSSNSSYKRAALLALPGALEDWLDHQDRLQQALLAQGQRMLFAVNARLWHLNISQPRTWALRRLDDGRVFGAGRSVGWPAARRGLYVLAAPLIPLVNLWRLLGVARRTGSRGRALLGLLPALVAIVTLRAAGEVAGYVFPAAAALARLQDREFNRPRFISAHDLQRLDTILAQLLPPPAPAHLSPAAAVQA
jgi:hypothetical protein